ncbi:MAG TPA: class I SAM-dependent methyltransferase [Xanthobacteraceae bacterium]|nr:class I SAM-dependent methyltransferase [Xanthobacteraceae bacterium]
MNLPQSLPRAVAATCFATLLSAGLAGAPAFAQPAPAAKVESPAAKESEEFKPQVGQRGKDVIWVPTPQALVDRMLDMARVTVDDFVIDLGSGDGRTVITAAKRGVKAMGIEYNPDMVELSTRNAAKEGVSDKASFVKADLFETDFSQASVITMFLLSDINLRLRPKILDMKPGTRIVSNTFDMGDWKSDDMVQAREGCTSYCRAYFWIVPAKVEGNWKIPDGELSLEQSYQFVTGTLKAGGKSLPVEGRLRGDQFTFKAGETEYTGTVSGDTIEGVSKTVVPENKWQATRAK